MFWDQNLHEGIESVIPRKQHPKPTLRRFLKFLIASFLMVVRSHQHNLGVVCFSFFFLNSFILQTERALLGFVLALALNKLNHEMIPTWF